MRIKNKKELEITVVGLGYVGLSNAILLAQNNKVVITGILNFIKELKIRNESLFYFGLFCLSLSILVESLLS